MLKSILRLLTVAGVTASAVVALARPAISEYEVLKSFPAGRLAALTAGDMPDANGLSGSNRLRGSWTEAGPQRGSCRRVIAAVVAGDLADADAAWRGIEVAFAHQRADGGFAAVARPDGAKSSALDFGGAVETAFFFLQEYGRAVLVIRESPHAEHFRARIAALEPKLRRACDFIASGYDQIIKDSSHAVNRIVIAAKAFGLCGTVLGDEKLIQASRRLVSHALTLRDKEGVFIENGGRDSSYNVVSILFGQVLALHVDLPELESALASAMAWQLSRIRGDGEVDVTGNTRTGVGKEPSPYTGKAKTVNYTEVVWALTLYGVVHRDAAALEAAERVFAYARKHPKPSK